MGRLTLNVLLSFAQFEREVTTTAQSEAGKRRRAYEFSHRCPHEHAKHIPLIRRATSFCDLAAVMVPSVAGDLHDASSDESRFRQLSFELSRCNVLP
jgi:hypothetical protein